MLSSAPKFSTAAPKFSSAPYVFVCISYVYLGDHFFPLLFPKDSESLKFLDIGLREVGAKRRLNGTSKVNRRTDGRTDRRTFRLIESIGTEGRCFENQASNFKLGTFNIQG